MYANAGVADDAPANELSYEKWKRTIDINFCLGYSFLINIRLNNFLNKVQVVSSVTLVQFIVLFHYLPQQHTSSAKGGGCEKLLTQNLCTAYAKYGIRINAVCPGYIHTPLLGSVNPQQKEYLASLHPQGRLGTPEEVANAVLF